MQQGIRNLLIEDIVEEIQDGIKIMQNLTEVYKVKKLRISYEGMGEASYNIVNCLEAFSQIIENYSNVFEYFTLRISSVGNIILVDNYLEFYNSNKHRKNIDFQLKLSLHTPSNEEREYLFPIISKKYSLLLYIIKEFYRRIDILGGKLIVNNLLLGYPDG